MTVTTRRAGELAIIAAWHALADICVCGDVRAKHAVNGEICFACTVDDADECTGFMPLTSVLRLETKPDPELESVTVGAIAPEIRLLLDAALSDRRLVHDMAIGACDVYKILRPLIRDNARSLIELAHRSTDRLELIEALFLGWVLGNATPAVQQDPDVRRAKVLELLAVVAHGAAAAAAFNAKLALRELH